MTIENVKCPDCGGPMISRKSQYGVFWGCKDYPKCKGTRDSMGESKKDKYSSSEEESNDLPSDKLRKNDKARFRNQ